MVKLATSVTLAALVYLLGGSAQAAPLAALYSRIAKDLQAGKPLVVTVHVALCDNRVIWCGGRGLGNGDRPARNLYWGAAGGFRAYFDRQRRTYKRVMIDKGDGKLLLERAVYRRRVARPSATWRRRGVKRPFDVYLVGLAYRGTKIGEAMDALVHQVAADDKHATTLTLRDGTRLATGAAGHIVGYAGHNHLMDVVNYRFPTVSRAQPVGYFALACRTSQYLGKPLRDPSISALLLTRTLMYPGAFTADGIVRGVTEGTTAREVFRRGASYYARYQKRPERLIRRAFTYGARRRRAPRQ